MRSKLLAAAVAVGALFVAGCGGSSGGDTGENTGPQTTGDAGDAVAGEDVGPGLPDAGAPDAAIPADASTPDATLPPATRQGWTFWGTAQGGPSRVNGVSADHGGNIWVAGGQEGLFLLRHGASRFERFTMGDGLHPYGYPRSDQGTITRTYLEVLSVAGGPAGTVFVGYAGMPPGPGEWGCEDNWDGPSPDPNIFKSGDADKVTLTSGGIRVAHYDISSGLNVVPPEPRGREKVCDVYRILYDENSASLWFGGNHGYAWGDPNYAGNPNCYGQHGCSGVLEHAHPLLNGYNSETATSEVALTNYYYGLAMGPSGDLWVGGRFRSQRCYPLTRGLGFWDCESQALSTKYQIDWWPDRLKTDSRPSQRTDDRVSGFSIGPDGSLWIGSFDNGLAHRDPNGGMTFITTGLVDPLHVTAVQVDPLDGSVWVGANSGGLTRIRNGQFVAYGAGILGGSFASGAVPDIQIDSSGGKRRILVAFRRGGIGIYEGD